MTTNPTPAPHHAPAHMTGAELQTLREACAMSREDLADLAGVQARTLKHWENGRAGVPDDVAALVRRIDHALYLCARAELDALRAAWVPGSPVALVRYKTAPELRGYIQAIDAGEAHHTSTNGPKLWDGVPFCAAGAVAQRVAQALRFGRQEQIAQMQILSIVWFDAPDFAQWLTVHNMQDSEAARMAWARDTVAKQAIPHRADQPPA